jgi:hypothetical protein
VIRLYTLAVKRGDKEVSDYFVKKIQQYLSKCQNYARFEQYPSVTCEAIRKSCVRALMNRINV